MGVGLSGRLLDFLTTEAQVMGLAKSAAARVLVLALLERWAEEGQLDVDPEARPGRSRPRGAILRYERSVWFSDDEHALLRTYAARGDLALGAALREALRIEIYARRIDRGLPVIGDYVD